MAEKNRAYRRFEELTRQAMAPIPAEAERNRSSTDLWVGSGGGGLGSSPADALPIRLSPELRRALEEHAAATNTTPAEIVVEALRRYLEIQR